LKKDKPVMFALIFLLTVFMLGVIGWGFQEILSARNGSNWDIAVRFDSAQQHPFYPFSKTPGIIGKTYHARLNAADNLYEEYVGRECCASEGWNNFAATCEEEQARRPKGWYVERKPINPRAYRILLRGVAWADCAYEQLPYVKGVLTVNQARGWKITQVLKNTITPGGKGQVTYFKSAEQSIGFASGNGCGDDCCSCADSAWLDIELIVKKQ
jgi:hypothetical protein